MTSALMIWGMALMSEITAILRPSLREIMRRGRRTRSIRMTLMKSMLRLLKMIEISYTNVRWGMWISKRDSVEEGKTYRKDHDDEVHDVPRNSKIGFWTVHNEAIWYDFGYRFDNEKARDHYIYYVKYLTPCGIRIVERAIHSHEDCRDEDQGHYEWIKVLVSD